jgi:hypothetical protein
MPEVDRVHRRSRPSQWSPRGSRRATMRQGQPSRGPGPELEEAMASTGVHGRNGRMPQPVSGRCGLVALHGRTDDVAQQVVGVGRVIHQSPLPRRRGPRAGTPERRAPAERRERPPTDLARRRTSIGGGDDRQTGFGGRRSAQLPNRPLLARPCRSPLARRMNCEDPNPSLSSVRHRTATEARGLVPVTVRSRSGRPRRRRSWT